MGCFLTPTIDAASPGAATPDTVAVRSVPPDPARVIIPLWFEETFGGAPQMVSVA